MTAIGVCALAFVLTYSAGRKSFGWGLAVLLVFGYFYGILRANIITTASHFIFDCGVTGLYLAVLPRLWDRKAARHMGALRIWTLTLIVWPAMVFFLPFQSLLVSLVGLRGCVFFLPALLMGARSRDKDVQTFAYGMAVLNIVVFGFAAAEYVMGLERFYPRSPVTTIIYMSGDVAGGFFRIPATFANAHSYGGTMVYTLPFLTGLLERPAGRFSRALTILGIASALGGVLMSAARMDFLMAATVVGAYLLLNRSKKRTQIIFLLLVATVGWMGFTNDRLGRFKSLSDTDFVSERIAGSVNRGFWEILVEYPMGNGLGGGGTSMPYFLQGEVRNPIGMENSYALILCEQGIVGLLLWLGFLCWFVSRVRTAFARGAWSNTRRTAWSLAFFSMGTAWIGTGLFTSVPSTVLLLLIVGWTTVPPEPEAISTADGKGAGVQVYAPSVS